MAPGQQIHVLPSHRSQSSNFWTSSNVNNALVSIRTVDHLLYKVWLPLSFNMSHTHLVKDISNQATPTHFKLCDQAVLFIFFHFSLAMTNSCFQTELNKSMQVHVTTTFTYLCYKYNVVLPLPWIQFICLKIGNSKTAK